MKAGTKHKISDCFQNVISPTPYQEKNPIHSQCSPSENVPLSLKEHLPE